MASSKTNLVSTSELAKIFQVSPGTIYKLAIKRKIPFTKSKTNRYLFDVDKVWNSLPTGSNATPHNFPLEDEMPLLKLSRRQMIRRLSSLSKELSRSQHENKILRHAISQLISFLPPKHRKAFSKYGDALSPATGNNFIICMYCRSVGISENDWISPDSYLSLFYKTSASHGICPKCQDLLKSDASCTMNSLKTNPIGV